MIGLDVLQTPTLVIHHWMHRGDLTLLIDGTYTYARSDQVDALAGTPACLGLTATLAYRDDPYELVADAIARAQRADTPLAHAFADWLTDITRETNEYIDAERANLRPTTFDAYSVRRAAAALSYHPDIRIGQQRLFQHMANLGWITRETNTAPWSVTDDATTWLTVRTVPVITPTGRHQYPQIYVLPAGLDQLRTTLTPARPPAPATDQPMLFD